MFSFSARSLVADVTAFFIAPAQPFWARKYPAYFSRLLILIAQKELSLVIYGPAVFYSTEQLFLSRWISMEKLMNKLTSSISFSGTKRLRNGSSINQMIRTTFEKRVRSYPTRNDYR